MTRALRFFLECETWNKDGVGSERRDYRRWFKTRLEAEAEYPRIRKQLQKDFRERFIELRIVEK